ncbi:hypothetical protein LguiB_017250 [Lonicera macranthoides]
MEKLKWREREPVVRAMEEGTATTSLYRLQWSSDQKTDTVDSPSSPPTPLSTTVISPPLQPPAPHAITVTTPAPPTPLRKPSSSITSISSTKRELKNGMIPWRVIRCEPVHAIRIGGLYAHKVVRIGIKLIIARFDFS